MKSSKKLISIVIPAYNEELVLELLVSRLKEIMQQLLKYNFEVIIVDNGSTDKTFEILKKIHESDNRFKAIQLSRNFMPIGAQSAALQFAKGDAAIVMCADLQDPPETILQFIAKWEEGYEVVYGVIIKRKGVSLIRKIISPLFYYFIFKLTGGLVPRNVTDFRLMDKIVYQEINKMPEHNRYFRGMVSWVGFKQIGVPFVRAPRPVSGGGGGGVKNFKLFKFLSVTIKFMCDGIFSFSVFPLRLITFVGLFTSFLSFFMAIYYSLYYLVYGATTSGFVKGYTSTILIILFLFGVLFFFMGIMGEYIGRIYDEVKQRPIFIIRRSIGFKK